MLACELDPKKFDVSVYESNGSLGRKFLVAGDGGLNLTHSEKESDFIKRYTPSLFFEKAFNHFSNVDFVKWLNDLGIETFVGSSGRVFPKKGIKPVEVLNTFLKKIKNNSVSIYTKYEWQGFSNNDNLLFYVNNDPVVVKADLVVFCLGGASWPITGSNGNWVNYLENKGINIAPFKASNCAFKINWDKNLVLKIEGKVLKNVSITCGNKTHFGEAVITKFGIEGSGIYPLSSQIREQLAKNKKAEITIDFKPALSLEKILEKLNSDKRNLTENLKTELKLSPLQMHLLKSLISKEDFLDLNKLAVHLKHFKLIITDTAPIEEAISTVGGISLNEINENFELKNLPGYFAIGEMLDYDAPTGGYLLQSCFSMGKYLADYFNKL